MTLQELLIQHRGEAKLSQRQFAEKCGLSNGYISMLESGKNPRTGKPIVPQFPALAKIATGMGITLTELLTTVDNMPVEISKGVVYYSSAFKASFPLTEHEEKVITAYRDKPAVQPKVDELLEVEPLFNEPSNVVPLPYPITFGPTVPVLGRIPAGTPIEAVTDFVDTARLTTETPKPGYEYFGLLVTGHSMEPYYHENDYVIIRVQPDAKNGDDVVAYIGEDHDATLKRLLCDENGIEFRALNEEYKSYKFTNQEAEEQNVSIAGIVVELIRRHGELPRNALSKIYGNPRDSFTEHEHVASPGIQNVDEFFSTKDKDDDEK